MFVPKIDDGVPVRQTALAEIDRVVSERLGRARVAGNAQPAAFNPQVAMYLAKRVGGWSLTKIGKFYNGWHHTTVCHAIQRIEALRDVNPVVDGLLAVLIDQIKPVGNGLELGRQFALEWPESQVMYLTGDYCAEPRFRKNRSPRRN